MNPTDAATKHRAPGTADPAAAPATVRYQITDVERAIAFYTEELDFKLVQKTGTVFAMVARGPLHLILGGPGSSGSRPLPDGRRQEPGGWNRIVLYVSDLDAQIQKLKTAGARLLSATLLGEHRRDAKRSTVSP